MKKKRKLIVQTKKIVDNGKGHIINQVNKIMNQILEGEEQYGDTETPAILRKKCADCGDSFTGENIDQIHCSECIQSNEDQEDNICEAYDVYKDMRLEAGLSY